MKPLLLALLLSACATTDLGDYGRRLGASNGYIGDVCFERDDPRACIEDAARNCAALQACAEPGRQTAAARCDPSYHRATDWEFYADDRPGCPDLRRPGG